MSFYFYKIILKENSSLRNTSNFFFSILETEEPKCFENNDQLNKILVVKIMKERNCFNLKSNPINISRIKKQYIKT